MKKGLKKAGNVSRNVSPVLVPIFILIGFLPLLSPAVFFACFAAVCSSVAVSRFSLTVRVASAFGQNSFRASPLDLSRPFLQVPYPIQSDKRWRWLPPYPFPMARRARSVRTPLPQPRRRRRWTTRSTTPPRTRSDTRARDGDARSGSILLPQLPRPRVRSPPLLPLRPWGRLRRRPGQQQRPLLPLMVSRVSRLICYWLSRYP